MKLYKKVGRRYVEMGTDFSGFPADGFWLVRHGHCTCLLEIGTPAPIHALNYLQHKLELEDEIVKQMDGGGLCVREISAIACEFFAKKITEETPADKDKPWQQNMKK